MSLSTATGVVTKAPRGSGRTIRNTFAERDDLALHSLRVVNVPPDRSGRQRDRLRQRCRHWSISAGELEQLDAAIVDAPPTAAAAMAQLVDLCIADTGFVLVIVDDEGARIPPSFAEVVQKLFAATSCSTPPRTSRSRPR